MKISKEEMETILYMHEVVTFWEGQEPDRVLDLVERIRKEKGR